MKTLKFVCAALTAVMVLAGCSKEEVGQKASNNYKSVSVKIANISTPTKLGGYNGELRDQRFIVKSLQFFFSDGTTLYSALDENRQPADTYLDAEDLQAFGGNLTASFHFLSPAVKEVIVIANLPESKVTSKVLLNQVLEIVNYQDVENFPLYAEGPLVQLGENKHDGYHNDDSNVYKVDLTVLPRVARFEIKKIGCNFKGMTDKKIVVKSMAFTDFYDKCDFMTGLVDLSSLRSLELEKNIILDYLANSVNYSKWNNDIFDGADDLHPEIILTPESPSQNVNIAYNFFPSGLPVHILDLVQQNYSGEDLISSDPGFIYTNTYKMNSGVVVPIFEPGRIYKMNFVFDIDKLSQMDKCVDITLTVESWKEIEVTPEFN